MKLPKGLETSSINFKDPIIFREYFKVIMREWAQYLTGNQLSMVMFIYDRTAAWGKEWELIRYSSFVNGIKSKDGAITYSQGVCGCRDTARRTMGELAEMGTVNRHRTRDGYWWAINYSWKGNNMKRSNKRREMQHHEWDDMQHHEVADHPPRKYLKVKGNVSQKKTIVRPSGRTSGLQDDKSSSTIDEALARARKKGQAARERQELRKKGKMNSEDISRHWTIAMRDAPWAEIEILQSGKLYLVKREAQALKSYSDRFLKSYPHEAFKAYLTWVIHHWPGLRTEAFGWMTKFPPPETPHGFFIIKWAATFEEKYLQRSAFEKTLDMLPEERKVMKLVKSGMSPDAARKKAGITSEITPPAKIIPIRRKTKPIKTRTIKRNNISLPSVKGNYANEYED